MFVQIFGCFLRLINIPLRLSRWFGEFCVVFAPLSQFHWMRVFGCPNSTEMDMSIPPCRESLDTLDVLWVCLNWGKPWSKAWAKMKRRVTLALQSLIAWLDDCSRLEWLIDFFIHSLDRYTVVDGIIEKNCLSILLVYSIVPMVVKYRFGFIEIWKIPKSWNLFIVWKNRGNSTNSALSIPQYLFRKLWKAHGDTKWCWNLVFQHTCGASGILEKWEKWIWNRLFHEFGFLTLQDFENYRTLCLIV